MSSWQAFWDLIYDALVKAVSLQWAAVVQIGEDLVAWWETLWYNIDQKVQAVRHALDSAIGLVYQTRQWLVQEIHEWIDQAIAYVLEQVQAVIDWVEATLADLGAYISPYIDAVKTWVQDLLQTWLDAARDFINPYIEAAKTWVTDTFGWILDLYDLLTTWLAAVQDAINWLATYAWAMLQSFLADPWGFVLGQLGATIISVVNWWLEWATPLSDFLTQDLPGLRNFMALGLDFLVAFMSNPLQTILDLLYPVFLDWLEQLIEDAW